MNCSFKFLSGYSHLMEIPSVAALLVISTFYESIEIRSFIFGSL